VICGGERQHRQDRLARQPRISDIMPEGKKDTGRPNLGAPLTTASGLIFIGATDDSRFRAFETKTGKEIWTYKMEASAHASPVAYQGTDGKQYVAVWRRAAPSCTVRRSAIA